MNVVKVGKTKQSKSFVLPENISTDVCVCLDYHKVQYKRDKKTIK